MAHPAEFPLAAPEDHVLCRHYRPQLPQFNWADEALAHEFSFERTRAGPRARSFGFHGMFNWPYVLTDAQIEARVVRATGYVLRIAALPRNGGGVGGAARRNERERLIDRG